MKPTTEVLSDVEEEETTTIQQPTKNVVDGKDFVKLTKKALKLGAESLDFSNGKNSKYLCCNTQGWGKKFILVTQNMNIF